jgi:catechol 2,3-dioxygenase
MAVEEELPWGIPPDGHRLPAGTRPGPVRLQVSDLDRSLDFYEGVLGFQVGEGRGSRAVLVAGGEAPAGDRPPLIELQERPGARPVPRRGRLGLYHFAVLVPDRAALGRFAGHLARIGAAAGASDHRVSEAFYLQDPDGLGVEIYADRPRSAWRQEGRQLVMATDPLDVEDLIREAGDEPWTGMPRETAIGHLHLHVGDLGRAEAFYHRALGLDKVVWSYPGALFLSAGGYHHHLGVNTWARGAAPAEEGDARLLEWELQLPSAETLAQTVESLKVVGASAEEADASVRVRDPWGTALRLRAP